MNDKPIWRQAYEATKQQQYEEPPQEIRREPAPRGDPLAELMAKLDASKPLAAHRATLPAALREGFDRAQAIEELESLLTNEVMGKFYPLMNTPLGFRTDRGKHSKRNPEPYSVDEVRIVFVQALLWGLPLIGNMFNIIAGQCYITVDGFGYLLRQLEHTEKKVTDLEIHLDIPVRHGPSSTSVTVPFTASWRQQGTEQGYTGRIAVRADADASVDQILGKALRKVRARVYQVITGTTFTRDGDVESTEELLDTETQRRSPSKRPEVDGPVKPRSQEPTPQKPSTPESGPTPDSARGNDPWNR